MPEMPIEFTSHFEADDPNNGSAAEEFVTNVVRNLSNAGVVKSVNPDGSIVVEGESDEELIALMMGAGNMAMAQMDMEIETDGEDD